MTSIDVSTMSAGDADGAPGPGNADAFEDLQPRGVVELSAKGRAQVESLIPIAKKLEGQPWTPAAEGPRDSQARAAADVRHLTNGATNRAERAA